MSDVLKHRFVSPKLDGGDTQQVQPSHWNDGHKFQGGVAGDVLTRDPADVTFGAKWITPAASIANPIVVTATGTVHNLACGPASAVTYISFTNAADVTVTGFAFTTPPRPGDQVIVQARGAGHVYCAHLNANSLGVNQLQNLATSGATPLAAGTGRALYVYGTAGPWILHQHDQGSWITPPYSAADYSATVGSWTVEAADVNTCSFCLSGRTLAFDLIIRTGSIPSATTWVARKLPNGFLAGHGLSALGKTAGGVFVLASASVGNNLLYFYYNLGTAQWPVATNTQEMDIATRLEVA